MPKDSRRLLPVFLAFLCLATVLPGLFLSFEDSEVWGITSSRRVLDHPLIGTSAHFKPLFSLIFGIVIKLSNSDWNALMGSRWVAIAFASGGIFSFFAIGLEIMKNDRRRFVTLAVFAIVCTMPLILIHFTKARSDSMSASIILITGFLLMLFEFRSRALHGMIYVAGAVLALLVTPKSIDLVVALGAIFWITDRTDADGAKPEKRASSLSATQSHGFNRLMWLVGPAATIFAVSLLISRDFIVKSLTYWIHSYEGVEFFSRKPWVAIESSIATAPAASFLIAVGLLAGIVSYRRLPYRQKALVAVGAITGLFIIIHSQKFHFFLASRVFFLALGALPGIHVLVEWLLKRIRERTVLAGFSFLFALSLTFTGLKLISYPGFQMARQKAAHQSLNQYLSRTGVHSYWDAIGLFPIRNVIFHYPSPTDQTNNDLLTFVEMSRPQLVLRTSKMELLEPGLMTWLYTHYTSLGQNIYVRFLQLREPLRPSAGTSASMTKCSIEAAKLLELAKIEQLETPLALIVKNSNVRTWIRVPFRTVDGKTFDSLGEHAANETAIRLPDCENSEVEYGLSVAGPWDALPAPYFSQFFGYNGIL